MKYTISLGLFSLISLNAWAQLAAPNLALSSNNHEILLSWDKVDKANNYTLFYTPYPMTESSEVKHLALGHNQSFVTSLWEGANYSIAIQATNDNQQSEYSNIETFKLSSNHLALESTPGSFFGLSLVAPMTSKSTYLIDDLGNIKQQWESNYTPALSAYLLPNGNLLRTGNPRNSSFDAGGVGGIIEEYNWNGELIWQFSYSQSDKVLHHDIERLPNGNTLALSWELKGELWTEVIVEIEKDGLNGGNIIWSWDVWDHLDELGLNPNNARIEDWVHLNSIDYNQGSNQIMVSSRSHNQVWIINKSDGSIAKISSIESFGQHDAKWIDDTDPQSNITLFDNGRNYSRSLELNSDLNQILWSYGNQDDEYFYASHISGTQRLANGNTLICDGVNGTILEIAPNGKKLREFVSPFVTTTPRGDSNEVFRVEKYGSAYTPYF